MRCHDHAVPRAGLRRAYAAGRARPARACTARWWSPRHGSATASKTRRSSTRWWRASKARGPPCRCSRSRCRALWEQRDRERKRPHPRGLRGRSAAWPAPSPSTPRPRSIASALTRQARRARDFPEPRHRPGHPRRDRPRRTALGLLRIGRPPRRCSANSWTRGCSPRTRSRRREGEPNRHRIEIVHESLLKAWPRLVRWQTQDEDGAHLRDQLKQAAHLWAEKGRTRGPAVDRDGLPRVRAVAGAVRRRR